MLRAGGVALACALTLLACDEDDAGCGGCGPCTATVTRIVDGDTVELASGEKVRYLGIDTPETTRGKNECYGQEAKAFNESRVLGQTVRLEYDQQCTDGFTPPRLLAYVYVDGEMLNREMLRRGYARVLIIPPNGRYENEMNNDTSAARNAGVGLWGQCGG